MEKDEAGEKLENKDKNLCFDNRVFWVVKIQWKSFRRSTERVETGVIRD